MCENKKKPWVRFLLSGILVSGCLPAVIGQQCPYFPPCCEEDCCGPKTSWEGSECLPDPSSPGFTGSYSSEHVFGCVIRECCGAFCCGSGTIFDPYVGCCVLPGAPIESLATPVEIDGHEYNFTAQVNTSSTFIVLNGTDEQVEIVLNGTQFRVAETHETNTSTTSPVHDWIHPNGDLLKNLDEDCADANLTDLGESFDEMPLFYSAIATAEMLLSNSSATSLENIRCVAWLFSSLNVEVFQDYEPSQSPVTSPSASPLQFTAPTPAPLSFPTPTEPTLPTQPTPPTPFTPQEPAPPTPPTPPTPMEPTAPTVPTACPVDKPKQKDSDRGYFSSDSIEIVPEGISMKHGTVSSKLSAYCFLDNQGGNCLKSVSQDRSIGPVKVPADEVKNICFKKQISTSAQKGKIVLYTDVKKGDCTDSGFFTTDVGVVGQLTLRTTKEWWNRLRGRTQFIKRKGKALSVFAVLISSYVVCYDTSFVVTEARLIGTGKGSIVILA